MAKKILTVVGARPQFVKAAAFSRAIAAQDRLGWSGRHRLEETIVHTGQHYDQRMSQSFFDELEIPEPAVNLEVGSGPNDWQISTMLPKLEKVMLQEDPDWVLVYGDTNSTLAGALAAVKLDIPVVHVEAGLRSFNCRMPEEINRVMTDAMATVHFAPSKHAAGHLAREGITRHVFVEGDVMYDALLHFRSRAIAPEVAEPFALATIHRAENTDDAQRLKSIMTALAKCPIRVILPLHPRTRKCLIESGITVGDNVRLIEPISYLAMLGYLEKCSFVVTDSGGLQKESYFMGKRCIVTRDQTEWVELVDIGANRLVGADHDAVVGTFAWAMNSLDSALLDVYGRGDSAQRMVTRLAEMPDASLTGASGRVNRVSREPMMAE